MTRNAAVCPVASSLMDPGERLLRNRAVSPPERSPRTALRPSSMTRLIRLEHPVKRARRTTSSGSSIDGDVHLHRRADESLQQRVVQFPRDAGSLRETFFEA